MGKNKYHFVILALAHLSCGGALKDNPYALAYENVETGEHLYFLDERPDIQMVIEKRYSEGVSSQLSSYNYHSFSGRFTEGSRKYAGKAYFGKWKKLDTETYGCEDCLFVLKNERFRNYGLAVTFPDEQAASNFSVIDYE